MDAAPLLLRRLAQGVACLHQTEKSSYILTKVGLNSSAFGRVIEIAGDDGSKLEDDTSNLSDSINELCPFAYVQTLCDRAKILW